MFRPYRLHAFAVCAILASALVAVSTSLLTTVTVVAHDAMPGSIVYRVNAGGPAITSTPSWSVDMVTMPSPHSNATATGNKVYTTASTIDMTHPSVPAGTPVALFKTERYVAATAVASMQWDFPVSPGTYEVRLYFAELYFKATGARIFDVAIEGTNVLPGYDIVADAGPLKGVMKSFVVTADGNIDIDLSRVKENPKINAIEIINVGQQAGSLVATPTSLAFGSVIVGQTKTLPVQLTNPAAAGGSSIVVDLTSVLGTDAAVFSDNFNDAGDVTLAPGQSTTVNVTFAPAAAGSRTATLELAHSGTNSPLPVALSGTGSTALPGLWQSLPGTGLNRQEVAYIQVGGLFYLAGGSSAHQAYNPATRTWSTLPSLPNNVDHVQAVTLGGQIYYIGGLTGWPGPATAAVHIYDPPTSSFTAGVPMARARGGGGVAVHNGKIYYAGGLSGGKAVPWFDVFDPATLTWTALPDMPVARDHFHAAVVGSRFYVTGGRDTAIDATITSTIAYDFATGTWQTSGLAPLPTARGGFAAAVIGSEILIIGGEGGGATYPNVEAYDTASNTWRSLSPMPTPRHGIQAAVCNGGVYIAAGGKVQGGGQPSSVHEVLFPAGTATTCGTAPPPPPPPPASTIRVNAGGPSVAGTPAWAADTAASPSPYVNAAATGNKVYTTTTSIATTHPSIPAGTPASLFSTERYVVAGGPTMEWNIPVAPGSYDVRLYFAELYYKTAGSRVFNVAVEGTPVLQAYDVVADVGAFTGVVKSFVVTTADGNIDIDLSRVKENPKINAIEIVSVSSQPGALLVSPSSLAFGTVLTGQTKVMTLQIANGGTTGDPSIVIDATSITGTHATQFTDGFNDAADVTLAPGQSASVTVTFRPTTTGIKNAQLSLTHSGSNSPVAVPLTGTGASSATVGFGKSTLVGTGSLNQPTSLQFGPDGRLYVSQQNGLIRAFTVARQGVNNYAVTATETLSQVQAVPNHNDDGTLNGNVNTRLITGILVAGTATQPVIYVAHSDPRIGAGPTGADLNLDTNSSMISRLTKTATGWQKVDLVRGLPRSEENHAANGMQLDAARGVLYVAMGGNTNMGGTSNNFAMLPEFALSAAILAVDLNAIGNTTYDLPTLDDETRAGTTDANDPFGGNNGLNQARLVPGGPVQIHAPGFRNPYDVLISQSGLLYTIDNGANSGWGGVPVGEGTDTCTNGQSEPGNTSPDSLHLITGPGYYGGHPNPTRGNVANKFNTSNPQSPMPAANVVECDYRAPGPASGALATFPASTNGLTEYTTANFEGALQGDLLAAAWNNTIYRIDMNAAGTAVNQVTALFSTVGTRPLDVQALGPTSPMPGTVWVGDHGANTIIVFEPNDFGGGGSTCTGAADPAIDEDRDGYDNKDEVDNGTNPCSAADVPPDWDEDLTSDRNDTDDDNDAVLDQDDVFALDAANGLATSLPLLYTWENDAVSPGGILNLGFTGLMTNGTSVYTSQFDPAKMTAGGAAGVLTVDEVAEGDAFGSFNSQQYGFQFGIPARPGTTDVFTVRTRVAGPYQGLTPQAGQSMGLFVGTGTQDDYAKIVVGASAAGTGIEFMTEVSGTPAAATRAAVVLPGPEYVDLYLRVDPDAATVQAFYAVTISGVTGAITPIGSPRSVPASWFTNPLSGLAVGILSTSRGPAPPFPATWDFMEVAPAAAIPTLQVAPTPVTFAETRLGESRTVTLTLTNGGSAPARNLVIDRTSITGVDAAQFSDGFDDAGNVTLAPGTSTSLTVTFTPTAVGDRAAMLEIVHSGADSPTQVALSGVAVSAAPTLVATPASVSFADTAVGQQRTVAVTLANSGAAGAPSIVVDATTIAGTDAVHFSDGFDDAGSVTLAPGASTTVVVTFAPSSAGSKSATLSVAHSGGNTPLLVPLSGNATQVTAILSATPSSFDFGKVGVGLTRTFTVTLTNAGTTSIVVDATSIGGANASQFNDTFDDAGNVTLLPGQSTTVDVTFRPTSPGGKSATLSVRHSGSNSPLTIPLAGNGSNKPR